MKLQITNLRDLTEEQRQALVDMEYANLVGGKLCPHCGQGFDLSRKDAVWSFHKTPAHEECFNIYEVTTRDEIE